MPLIDKADGMQDSHIGQQDQSQVYYGNLLNGDSNVIFVSPKSTGLIALMSAFVAAIAAVLVRSLSAK
jgi:hypothetical protein